ncbi:DUF4296 domain-containing protein [Tenacibaculum sp. S7007]|uniref:DUF4296 domain-containing protein n=1 Tax=Tenacibaculum pelagium TaxID=2759527 RepID=A0A839ATF4_9FLAO|nr:DUF4296 domain-containing protein [Tenacibaculum pelagium]MBA6156911.1 DUF4296 domain-containing protein [Tenacibaculum pelagium]
MRKHIYIIAVLIFLVSCTSNTMYKKPENLIPKDTMVSFLTEMYIASSAKNIKNKFLRKEKNYVMYVYKKYKIDSARFDVSNAYYTSKIEDYTEVLNKVKSNIDSIQEIYEERKEVKDSINSKKKLLLDDEIIIEKLERKNTKLQ